MKDDTTITELHQPGTILDPLTEIARDGARQMLMAALKAEAAGFVAQFAEERLPDGRQRVVLHGAGPERTIQTGIGAIPVRRPKVRDRATDAPVEKKIRFGSSILPKWARRSRSLDALLPILYLRGVSTGDFQEALTALLGKDAPNLSPGVIARLTAGWEAEYDRWQRRDLSARRYVYIWADGVYLQARMEPTAECMLVIIGATPEGRKELLGFQVGVRESAQSWRELLVDLKARGLATAPELAVGDGALGFWKALEEVFPGARHQRCWVHKIANVLNNFPKSMQPAVTADLHEISHAETRAAARAAIETFREKYAAKYERGVACLTKDTDALLARLTTSLRSTGITCAPRTRSRACSPPSATEPCAPRARCRRRQPSSWSSPWSGRPLKNGASSTAQISCRASSKASGSQTASLSPTPQKAAPPDRAPSPKIRHSSWSAPAKVSSGKQSPGLFSDPPQSSR